jgi:CO/xanthine dehydrogenase FAD-binding subunit
VLRAEMDLVIAFSACPRGRTRDAAQRALQEAEPLSDLMGSADYRREMIRVWVRRLLTALRDGRSLTPRSAVDQLMSQSP